MKSKEKKEQSEKQAAAKSFIFHGQYRKGKLVAISELSGKVRDVFGVAKTRFIEILVAHEDHLLIHSEDLKRVIGERKKLSKSTEPLRIQYRVLTQKKEKWVEEQSFLGPEKKGVCDVCTVIQDITEREEINRKLQQSETKYRRIFEKSLAGVYTTHVDGRILDCNKTFATILGYSSPEEIKKLRVKDIYFQLSDRDAYIAKLRKEGTLHHYTAVLTRKDGRRIIVDNNVSIAQDEFGKPNIIEGTLIDITDIHDAKVLLELGEKKYRLLFEEANNAIVLTSPGKHKTIIDINRVGLEMFRSKESEIIGMDISEVLVMGTGENGKGRTLLRAESFSPSEDVEIVFKRLDGETFFAEVWMSQLTLGDENFVQFVIHDISRRKRRERELLDSRQSFKNIVDRSLSAILIFDKELLVYKNPVGENLFKMYLNNKTNRLADVFPAQHKKTLADLFSLSSGKSEQFTEITLKDNVGSERSFSVSAADIIYNQRNAKLLVLHDISLQKEFHMQRNRAELAEYANRRLQNEIEEHKKTQDELLAKTSVLNAFHESSRNLFVLTLDRNYKLKSMNANFRNSVNVLLGKAIQEGEKFLDLFEKQTGVEEKFHKKFEAAFKGEPQEIISHFPARTGEFWVETFINPIFTEGREISEISLVAHDITEKVHIQHQIQNSEAETRAMLLAIPDFIFRVSADGRFTYSRLIEDIGALRQFFKTDDFVGKHIREVFIDEKLAEEFVENLNISLHTEGLHTQHFSFYLGEPKQGNKRFFENRFSKASDDEVVIIARDITEAMEYESRLIESVREKEILLKEVHHRVKNNLQVINSILNLQSNYVTDAKTLEFINESQNRIRTMSYIHESLYQTKNFSSINFRDYISTLVQNLVHSYEFYGSKTQLSLEVDKVVLSLDQAIPCGLILNELISNALKYAYPEKKKEDKISVRINEKNKQVYIAVEDYGVGLPTDFSIEHSDSLGLSLVDTLVKQLDGEMQLIRDSGTKYLIIFDKQEI